MSQHRRIYRLPHRATVGDGSRRSIRCEVPLASGEGYICDRVLDGLQPFVCFRPIITLPVNAGLPTLQARSGNRYLTGKRPAGQTREQDVWPATQAPIAGKSNCAPDFRWRRPAFTNYYSWLSDNYVCNQRLADCPGGFISAQFEAALST